MLFRDAIFPVLISSLDTLYFSGDSPLTIYSTELDRLSFWTLFPSLIIHDAENLTIPPCLLCILVQLRCEQILRSRPESRLAAELHLASIESKERQDSKKVKDAAVGSAVAVAAAGLRKITH